MSGFVFLAVLGAALLHAGWNAVAKSGADKRVSIGAVMLGHVPFAIATLFFVPAPAPESYPYLAGGIALHAGYQLFLLQSYRIGDLTQVYPIARGSAPLIVAVVSIGFLGVALNHLELLGVLIIACGIIATGMVRRDDGLRNGKAAVFALITGCFIAGYSLVDGLGARAAGTSFGFFSWLAIGNGVLTVSYLAITGRDALFAIPRQAKRVYFIGGGASFAAYAIVTWAFTQAPIALVTALRETSIVFALLIGVFFLKERLNLARVAATTATLAGAILVRIARP
jgi:drug/metabolite transporter (DMT)-like permease